MKQHDDDGFSGMFRRNFARLRKRLSRKGRAEDVDDLVQETMLRAWRRLGDEAPENERAYLNVIADRTANNAYRYETAEMRDGEHEEVDPEHLDLADHRSPERAAIARQLLARFDAEVATIMYALGEETQLCVVLHGRGLTDKAVARMLDISHVAVRSSLSRARKKFVERLGPAPEGHDWLEIAGAQR